MEQIIPDNWVYMHYGLIASITSAQLLVVYILKGSTHPPAGLGVYTVYFIATVLCWVAISLQLGSGFNTGIDVAAITTMMTSYILYYAAGQRVEISRGRLILGVVGLAAGISSFFLNDHRMFLVESGTVAVFCTGTAILAGLRAYRHKSVGDAMISTAATMSIIGVLTANYQFFIHPDLSEAHTIVYTVYSAAYGLIVIGFLGSVLSEYQHHLVQLATEDPLTGLLNRRGLSEALNVSLASASRQGTSTSAIMVDIDHFKKVNDNFGHEIGDRIIQQIAEILGNQARASDAIARVGGEEYLLVLPETSLESAKVLAERIRRTIDEQPLLVHRQSIHITVSLGIACIDGGANLEELSQSADRAMYLAKRGGRNRVASVEHRPVQMSTTPIRA